MTQQTYNPQSTTLAISMDMSDINIRQKGTDKFVISAVSVTGMEWLKENMVDTVLTIQKEFIQEIKDLIRNAGLTIEER